MAWSQWVPLALICLLGAMSPGPSLAVVARYSVVQGTVAGLLCAVTHGLGVFLWALLMVSGLGAIIVNQPDWFNGIRAAGALFLLYLATRVLTSGRDDAPVSQPEITGGRLRAAWAGMAIALLNPKIAVFFAALFSQFIRADAELAERLVLAGTAAVIDALWYALIAASLSRTRVLLPLQRHAVLLNRTFGVILVVLSLAVLRSVWQA
ncbi:MAG: LysE family translocator [Gammaproteobacteria bacterium]|jgi:threonine/homoserine/homoserine lactone efflux protein|nr:LysE family translocator [Gammaproteobacteria bacterium]